MRHCPLNSGRGKRFAVASRAFTVSSVVMQ
jgi:hypothetical protein